MAVHYHRIIWHSIIESCRNMYCHQRNNKLQLSFQYFALKELTSNLKWNMEFLIKIGLLDKYFQGFPVINVDLLNYGSSSLSCSIFVAATFKYANHAKGYKYILEFDLLFSQRPIKKCLMHNGYQ